MAEPWLICFFACNREMQPFYFFFVDYSLCVCVGGGILGRVRALNLTVPLGSGRVGSDNLGHGPGSGFSFEPVQTSTMNIGSWRMTFSIPRPSSRGLWTRCSVSSSTSLSSCTKTISWSTPGIWPNITITWRRSYANSGNTTSTWSSRSVSSTALRGLPTALATAEAFFHNLFRTFGIPEDVASGHGPQLVSRVWKAFFNLLDVTVSLSSGYNPQTNGQTERKIQEIGIYLSGLLSWQPAQLEPLPPVVRVCTKFPQANHSIPSSLSPFQCILGYHTVSLDRRALRHSSCRPLVPSEQDSLVLSSCPTPAGSVETWDLCRCLPVFHPRLSSWR